MRRFLIPAFFVVHAENEQDAEQYAGEMASWVSGEISSQDDIGQNDFEGNALLLDEELPTREVEILFDETELPHTYKE